ncbi:cyclic 3',5'-adenosine monophosphate phosphodiesterase [Caballeronia temeraria]|uniref:Cyclic 3',5'-adenosine monophosphate phosphodiesterase n=2 Tax=Caballeronia temeraria TaxID=1777137 RepID=A0A158ASY0_9BURK|nr:cyclic 3',5'-adenosine monophosphate phosphodiesterase [Caballeronia temeraria]
MLSWVHFGDLHASNDDRYESLNHLRSMIHSVNVHLADRIDFAFLPGDNANNGTPEQFERIAAEVSGLRVPLYAIPGDHDFEPGHLEAFNAFANMKLPMSRVVNGHRCIFLDVVSAGRGGPDFRLSRLDGVWLSKELYASAQDQEPPVVFMHAYPGDVFDGSSLAYAFARANVAVVDTGHTHYNELLNDGWVVYAATRSTGQIEEDSGRPGFSVAAVDGGVVSWKFHPYDAKWPFVMITRPADRRLHRSRSTPGSASDSVVRVLVSDDDVVSVIGELDGMPIEFAPSVDDVGIWEAPLPAVTASYRRTLIATAHTSDGRIGVDSIELAPVGSAASHLKDQSALGTDAHAVDPWPEHGILGSQLGPNKNGRHW